MHKLGKMLSSNAAITTHALIAGIAYFAIVMRFVTDYTAVAASAMLLGVFFCPAVICGAAVLLIKQMRLWRDAQNYRAIGAMTAANGVILLIGCIMGADMIINMF